MLPSCPFFAAGKTLPQWLSEKKRRSLSQDVDYRRRIELLQDFDFPTASQKVCASPDGQYVIVAGTYPPQIKGDTSLLVFWWVGEWVGGCLSCGVCVGLAWRFSVLVL